MIAKRTLFRALLLLCSLAWYGSLLWRGKEGITECTTLQDHNAALKQKVLDLEKKIKGIEEENARVAGSLFDYEQKNRELLRHAENEWIYRV